MIGTIIDDKNIIEYKTAQLLLSPQEYSISYIVSGQPRETVIEGYFTKSQATSREFVENFIKKDIYG